MPFVKDQSSTKNGLFQTHKIAARIISHRQNSKVFIYN